MSQTQAAIRFNKLHVKGKPLVLYNAWDAGSAKAIADGGAQAIATSSWAVAQAQGYDDGERIPVALMTTIAERIVASVDVPVTVDFEGGYSDDDKTLAKNISSLIETGAIGINFEDRVVKGSGLYPVARQAKRIAAIRKIADKHGVAFFINARTDVFFLSKNHSKASEDAIARAKHYAEAGASGLFVPGLTDDDLIAKVVAEVSLPVNVMVEEKLSSPKKLASLGVARISYGPIPYIQTIGALAKQLKKDLG